MDPSEQTATLELLREAVEQTNALYESAKGALNEARASCGADAANADENIVQAEQLFNEMSEIYRKVLKEFNQYILDGRGRQIR